MVQNLAPVINQIGRGHRSCRLQCLRVFDSCFRTARAGGTHLQQVAKQIKVMILGGIVLNQWLKVNVQKSCFVF